MMTIGTTYDDGVETVEKIQQVALVQSLLEIVLGYRFHGVSSTIDSLAIIVTSK